jgi:hypothetical protein
MYQFGRPLAACPIAMPFDIELGCDRSDQRMNCMNLLVSLSRRPDLNG